MDPSFEPLFIVFAVATAVPLALAFMPRLPLPAAVGEILAGIVVGPVVLGLVDRDDALVETLGTVGLVYLLFVAGLELDLRALVHPRLGRILAAYALTLGLAVALGYLLHFLDLIDSPLMVAIISCATALGVLLPIMKDQGLLDTEFGRLLFAACAIAEVVPIMLLTLFFTVDDSGVGEQFAKVAILVATAIVVGLGMVRLSLADRVSGVFARLSDTTAQLRIRETMMVLVGFAAIAGGFGIEVILGSFTAGVVIANAQRRTVISAGYMTKVEAVGFGVFIPVFFVSTGIGLDVESMFATPRSILLVPVLLLAFLVVRGLPALTLYPAIMSRPEAAAAGLFQGANLSFAVAATAVALELDALSPAVAAAIVSAGMLSVILYPPIGAAILRRRGTPPPVS